MNEDDAKDAAWDKLISNKVGVWFGNLPDNEAATIRAIFSTGWSDRGSYEADKRVEELNKASDLECEDCLGVKPDVKERECPYAKEIGLQTMMVTVCDDCRNDRSRQMKRNMM